MAVSPSLGPLAGATTSTLTRVRADPFVTTTTSPAADAKAPTPSSPANRYSPVISSSGQTADSASVATLSVSSADPVVAQPSPSPRDARSPLHRAHHHHQPQQPLPAGTSPPWPRTDRPVRAPDPAKRVPANDELHSVIDRQARAEKARDGIRLKLQRKLLSASAIEPAEVHASRVVPAPGTFLHLNSDSSDGASDPNHDLVDRDDGFESELSHVTPPHSPTLFTMATPPPVVAQPDPRSMPPHRTTSIDSNASNISSLTAAAAAQRPGAMQALRASQETSTPQDAATLIAAAGSAEAALNNLLEKTQQTASHNAQLWRLVEKQRAVILSLNSDLEKAMKEMERYKRKLKEHLAALPTVVDANTRRAHEPSRSLSEATPNSTPKTLASRNVNSSLRKASNHSDAVSESYSFIDRPASPTSSTSENGHNTAQAGRVSSRDGVNRQGPTASPSRTTVVLPGIAAALRQVSTTDADIAASSVSPSIVAASPPPGSPQTPFMSPIQTGNLPSPGTPGSASVVSPKMRKAPPAPLKLNVQPQVNITNNILDASESEYEDDPDSTRSEHLERGRRKTREDDDREREAHAQAREMDEQRSRSSKKGKKSKSKSKAAPPPPIAVQAAIEVDKSAESMEESPEVEEVSEDIRLPFVAVRPPQLGDNPVDIVRQRAFATGLQRNNTVPSLMSPGLPMSPRPGDRPPNSPMPRSIMNSIPMSPRAGLPLSPRAPRHALPLPPQTPVAGMAPHLDRAKVYHQQIVLQAPQTTSISERLNMPDSTASESSISPTDRGAGEVFQGFVTDEYPELLLPPNALASIIVTTASPRMKPSRQSFIAPKPMDENPVFTLAVHARSDNKQLWRVEKGYNALALLDQQVKTICSIRERLPDRALFSGHAPSKMDARRTALNRYFESIMDALVEEQAALIVCKFLSTDVVGVDGTDETLADPGGVRADTPVNRLRPNRAGYLTKRGKNFGGWKARFFVLDGPNLKYFEGPGGAHLGSIKLQNAQIGRQTTNNVGNHEDEENQFRHAFLILEPKKKDSTSLVRHVLCAESDQERDEWVNALLQYVDWKDDEEQQQLARQAQVSKSDISGPRSPRPQKSMGDLRGANGSSWDLKPADAGSVHAVGYSDTVAGEAPVMGGSAAGGPLRNAHTPSPGSDRPGTDAANHPVISGPSNPQLISNTGDWGMRPPPTPGPKDRKRSVFTLPFGRGRSSSDAAPGESKGSPSPVIPPQDRPHAPVRAVFGIPLAEAVEVARPLDVETELPAVVYRCIEYLTAQNAVAEEGIFRLSGSNTVIKSLKERFNHEGDVNLLAEGEYYDVHAVASLLKLYLRELPASILTRDLHLDFLRSLEMPANEKVAVVHSLVERLPPANRALLATLSAFMLLIVNNVEVNKMNVRNLGVVFSPTLNLPGPLISLFVEEQHNIFFTETTPTSPEAPRVPGSSVPRQTAPPTQPQTISAARVSTTIDLRSPRKQMFSDLPTPAFNQTSFHQQHSLNNPHLLALNPQQTGGFSPYADEHPSRAAALYTAHNPPTQTYIHQPEQTFASLNDALFSSPASSSSTPTKPTTNPGLFADSPPSTSSPSAPSADRDVKARRRESSLQASSSGSLGVYSHAGNSSHAWNAGGAGAGANGAAGGHAHLPLRKSSLQKLSEGIEESPGTRF